MAAKKKNDAIILNTEKRLSYRWYDNYLLGKHGKN